MAFVFRSDRQGMVPKDQTPGPGTYVKVEEPKTAKSYAPFGSTALRDKKGNKDEAPGPGSYNISVDLKNKGQNQKILVSSLTPDPTEVEKPKQSIFFKSKAKRFEPSVTKEETPGPGQYNTTGKIGKKYANPNATAGSQRYQMIERAIKNTKFLSIPSIPSNLHSYGYSETDNRDLILNKNPLLEVQQFVGPGYYEVKEGGVNKKKGATWHKSGTNRFKNFYQHNSTTANVGPGSYETAGKNVPLYKLKPSAGFASSSRRTVGDKSRGGGFGKLAKRNSATAQADVSRGPSAFGIDPFGNDEEDDDQEYIEDATPGPGYYYNETNSSSMKVQYKPFHLQNFGSVSLRFKDQNAKNYLGPGEYNVGGDLKRKKNTNTGKAPFNSSNMRFIRERTAENPGPGQYIPKTNLADTVEDRKRKGYLGNFGVTDQRFKAPAKANLPGPGQYFRDDDKDMIEDLTEVANKASHFFRSGTKRTVHTGKKEENPPPGAYDNKYYDIATKIIKEEEDPDLRPTRKPFNTGEERFKSPKLPEVNEDDEPPKTTNKNLDHLINQKKGKSQAPFNSTTKRTIPEKTKQAIPGPGAYHDPNTDKWNKRTFNILFTVD